MMRQPMVAIALTTPQPPGKPHARRRAAALVTDPAADLWTLAFAPVGAIGKSGELPAAVAELLRYARFNGGLDVVGIRLAVQPRGTGSPVEKRVARTLKHALRRCALRCVDYTGRPPRVPKTPTPPPRGGRLR